MTPIKPVSFTDPYAPEENDILRRQMMAQMLQQQASTPLGNTEVAPGGWAVRRSPLEGLAKVAQGAMGGYMGNQTDEKRRELIKQMQGDASKWYGQQPQGTPAGLQADAADNATQMPAQAPTQQQQEQWAMQGLHNPYSQPIAQMRLANIQKMNEPRVVGDGGVLLGPDNKPLYENKKDFKPDKAVTWSEPYRLGGAWVQKSSDGQIKTAVTREPVTHIHNPPAPTMSEVIDPKDPTRMLRVDAKTYKGGTLGDAGVLGVSGKEPTAAKREEKEGQGADHLKTEVANLKAHFKTLFDKGAIPSDKEGAMTNVQAWARNTGVGQLGGRMFGTEEQTARNEIQSARLRLMNAIKNATGMSAQQLNSNMELKTWLDSMTNLQGSYESNIGILDSLEKSFGSPKRRAADKNPSPDEPPPGAVRPRG